MKENTACKIRPEILLFMRRSAGMSEEEVAKKLKLPRAKYSSIEKGEQVIPQSLLIHLADIYKRPLIAFYSVNTEQTTGLPHDYRLNRDKQISPEVFLAKRKAIYLAGELREITGRATTLPEFNTNVSACDLAENVRSVMEIDPEFLKEVIDRKEETALGYYKSLIEERFFIPVLEHPLKTDGVRAFSVFGEVSVIVLNESDSNEVKLFSLMHEFCHLLKRQDGICTIDIEHDQQNRPEERYCDAFASNLLVPAKQLKNELQSRSAQVYSIRKLGEISRSFGISKQVMIIRMKELNFISQGQYNKLKAKLESVKAKGFGRRNWEQTYISRTSRLVLDNLIGSYRKGDITYPSLLNITGIKDKYMQQFI